MCALKIDYHVHCDSDDPALIRQLVELYAGKETMAALSGGPRYGAHDYTPNEQVIKICREYRELLMPIARIDLWDIPPDPALIHHYAELGVKGFKFIYPYYEYDHDSYMPLYAEIEKTGLPALFHTGNFRPSEADIKWQRPVLKNMAPLNLDRVARSFQKMNIILAHLGTTAWRQQAAELLKMHANIYADLAGCGSWQALSAEQLAELLCPYIPVLNLDARYFRKLIFGSDAYVTRPMVMPDAMQHYELCIRKLGLPEDIAKGIMGQTVASWLSLTA